MGGKKGLDFWGGGGDLGFGGRGGEKRVGVFLNGGFWGFFGGRKREVHFPLNILIK